jgi:hypothetical protein
MKQITLDGVTYNLVPVEQPKPASPFYISREEMDWSDAMDEAEEKKMRLLRSEELHVLARDGHLPLKKGWVWSSSLVSNDPSNAWYVYLDYGNTDYDAKTGTYRAVCVPKDFDLAVYLREVVG